MTTESASSPRKVDTWTAIACTAFNKRLRNESIPCIEGWATGIGGTELHRAATALGPAQGVEG